MQGETWAGSNLPQFHPWLPAAPANLLLHCLPLPCPSCLPTCLLARRLLVAWSLLAFIPGACLFDCLVPAIDCCCCRHHRPILPLCTFSNLHCPHIYQPSAMALFPVISIKLSHILWWIQRYLFFLSQITFQIAFSDVTFINYFHDLSVFVSLSFRSQAAITAQKMLTQAFYLSFQSLSLSQAITFDCSVTPSGLPSDKQRWVIKCIEPARKIQVWSLSCCFLNFDMEQRALIAKDYIV